MNGKLYYFWDLIKDWFFIMSKFDWKLSKITSTIFLRAVTHGMSKKTTKNIADEQWLNFVDVVIKICK